MEDYNIPEKKKKIKLKDAMAEWKYLEQESICPCVFSVYSKIKKQERSVGKGRHKTNKVGFIFFKTF